MFQPQLLKAALSSVSGCFIRAFHVRRYNSKLLIKQSVQPQTQVLRLRGITHMPHYTHPYVPFFQLGPKHSTAKHIELLDHRLL